MQSNTRPNNRDDDVRTPDIRGAALVTGAANRIGAAIAQELAFSGYPVIVHFRDSAAHADALIKSITKKGGKAAGIQANLADRGQRAGLINGASRHFGPLTTLVNNASIYEPDSIETLDEYLWDAHFAVHTEAPVFLGRDFAAQLPPTQEGNIVNIIDSRLNRLSPAYTSYTLSKAALWTATRTMAQSLAPQIRVNAISPGPSLPEHGQSDTEFEQRVADLPLGRGASPQEIAVAVRFLLNAPAVTGQMLALDGGSHLEWPARSNATPRRR